MAEIKVKISNGFECVIDDEMLDDMELVEDLAAVQNDDAFRLPDVIVRILGQEQKDALYESLRNEKGKVTVKAVTDALVEIFGASGEDAKNS